MQKICQNYLLGFSVISARAGEELDEDQLLTYHLARLLVMIIGKIESIQTNADIINAEKKR